MDTLFRFLTKKGTSTRFPVCNWSCAFRAYFHILLHSLGLILRSLLKTITRKLKMSVKSDEVKRMARLERDSTWGKKSDGFFGFLLYGSNLWPQPNEKNKHNL